MRDVFYPADGVVMWLELFFRRNPRCRCFAAVLPAEVGADQIDNPFDLLEDHRVFEADNADAEMSEESCALVVVSAAGKQHVVMAV